MFDQLSICLPLAAGLCVLQSRKEWWSEGEREGGVREGRRRRRVEKIHVHWTLGVWSIIFFHMGPSFHLIFFLLLHNKPLVYKHRWALQWGVEGQGLEVTGFIRLRGGVNCHLRPGHRSILDLFFYFLASTRTGTNTAACFPQGKDRVKTFPPWYTHAKHAYCSSEHSCSFPPLWQNEPAAFRQGRNTIPGSSRF